MNEYYKNMNFDYPKPVENTSFTANIAQHSPNQDKSALLLPENIEKYLEELIDNNDRDFKILT